MILIVGGRRSGKTWSRQLIQQMWRDRGLSYRYFSLERPSGVDRSYGGNPRNRQNVMVKSRGYRRVLVDEPGPGLAWEDIAGVLHTGVAVLATSEPQDWMVSGASWICRVAGPYTRHREIVPGGASYVPPPPPPTIWERLLAV